MKKYNSLSVLELIAWKMFELENKARLTKTERERLAEAKGYLANEKDSGRYGKAFEVLFVGKKSHKTKCSAQGKVDNYFYLDGKRYPVEYKINGGRIEGLYDHDKPEKAYIVYALDYTVPLRDSKKGIRGGEHRVIKPIIMTVKDFLTVIDTLHAFKFPEHKNKGDKEKAVSASSKKLYDCLLNYPVTFDPDYHYTSADFEDLELF